MLQNKGACILAVPFLLLGYVLAMDPPPELGRIKKEITNMTMDEAIMGTLGGIGAASNRMMDMKSEILAELDMYLSFDQFNNMYEPPKASDMVDMGLMPAPMGAPQGDPRRAYKIPADFQSQRSRSPREKRKAAQTAKPWTDGVVPYLFAKGHFTKDEEYMMRRSMTEWERYTCLKFVPATNDNSNSLRFQNGQGCNSQLGMRGGVQGLNLQSPGCRFKGLYLHEIGHAVGLVHEHQLPDRDNYISILYHNVSPHMRIWFNKYKDQELTRMKVPYELSSVMHYGITAFSKDGESQTIQAKDQSQEERIGRVYLKELAYTDVEIVNKFYQCATHCPDQNKCGYDGHLDENCNCVCRDGSNDCDRTKQKTDANCRNSYYDWPCYIWANQGECQRNTFYMNRDCAKACGACGNSNTQAQAVGHDATWMWQWFPMFTNMYPPQWNNFGQCKDVYSASKCKMWKDRGDCVTNSRWMKEHCGATCKMCTGGVRPEEDCDNAHDEEEKCERWAQDGECVVNRGWMQQNCRKSCHMCQDTDTDTDNTGDGFDEDDLKCENKNDNCEMWASQGECTINPPWMVANCRKACDKCDDGKCKNLYVDVRCEAWAEKLECVSNSEWMGKFCAKSCVRGVCTGDPKKATTSSPGRTDGTSTTPTQAITTPETGGSCVNEHKSDTECENWAKADFCDVNPSWMLKFCARSCAVYGAAGSSADCRDIVDKATTTTTTADPTGGKTNVCHDEEEACSVWAKAGHCDGGSIGYMLKSCKKSCNNCNGCRDSEFLCSAWAKADHCFKNPGYMLRHCQKSCKACTIPLDLEKEQPEGKEDSGSGNTGSGLSAVGLFWVVAGAYTVLLIG